MVENPFLLLNSEGFRCIEPRVSGERGQGQDETGRSEGGWRDARHRDQDVSGRSSVTDPL